MENRLFIFWQSLGFLTIILFGCILNNRYQQIVHELEQELAAKTNPSYKLDRFRRSLNEIPENASVGSLDMSMLTSFVELKAHEVVERTILNKHIYLKENDVCHRYNWCDSLKPKPPVIKVNPLKFQTKPPFYIRVTDNTPVTLRCSSNTLHVPGDIQALWYELNCVADVRYQVTNVYHEITAETTVKTNGKYVCQIRNGIETIEALTVVEFDGFKTQIPLTQKTRETLKSWIPFNFYNLCWSSSKHGLSIARFHDLCDGKSPTLSLFQISASRVVGGFTDTVWRRDGGYRVTKDAFLFDIEGDHIEKYPLNDPIYATYNYHGYGPCFGSAPILCMRENKRINWDLNGLKGKGIYTYYTIYNAEVFYF